MVQLDVITPETLDDKGFFCRMSKMKTDGNQRKLRWMQPRFDEGLHMTLLGDGGRGFVEVMPGEHCWRPVQAKGWSVIHCLWVVGKSKGHGHGAALLDDAIAHARAVGSAGLAVVTRAKNWVTPQSFFAKHGFEVVDEGADGFVLMTLPFEGSGAKTPKFTTHNWPKRLENHADGVVVFRTDQCPYLSDATDGVIAVAKELKLDVEVVELATAAQVRSRAPSPYGVFAIAFNGKLVTSTYALPKDLKGMLQARMS